MRILLVSPAFHGYWRSVADALRRRGHHVTTHVYDHHGAGTKLLRHHLSHELPARIGVGDQRRLARARTAAAIDWVGRSQAQAVVVLKGDVLLDEFWDHLDTLGLPRVTWLYDEIRRTRFTAERLARVGPIATYSPLDDVRLRGTGVDSRHLALALDHRLPIARVPDVADEVSFVGARYPNREQVLLAPSSSGTRVRAYGRDWSTHPYDRLRTWRVRSPVLLSARELDRPHAYGVLRESFATLNLHSDQDGFTMRTFEAAGVGGVQLIDRNDVTDYYEPDVEVLTWASTEELHDLVRKLEVDRGWARDLRDAARRRTLSGHTFDHRVATLEQAWATT